MRSNARKIALHLVFEKEFGKNQEEESLLKSELLLQEKVSSDEDLLFIEQLTKAVAFHNRDIKKILKDNIEGYTFDRIHRVDAAILLLAVAEIKFIKETDAKIIINEAVNLASVYGGEKSTSFVNGVLAKIIKE